MLAVGGLFAGLAESLFSGNNEAFLCDTLSDWLTRTTLWLHKDRAGQIAVQMQQATRVFISISLLETRALKQERCMYGLFQMQVCVVK